MLVVNCEFVIGPVARWVSQLRVPALAHASVWHRRSTGAAWKAEGWNMVCCYPPRAGCLLPATSGQQADCALHLHMHAPTSHTHLLALRRQAPDWLDTLCMPSTRVQLIISHIFCCLKIIFPIDFVLSQNYLVSIKFIKNTPTPTMLSYWYSIEYILMMHFMLL